MTLMMTGRMHEEALMNEGHPSRGNKWTGPWWHIPGLTRSKAVGWEGRRKVLESE